MSLSGWAETYENLRLGVVDGKQEREMPSFTGCWPVGSAIPPLVPMFRPFVLVLTCMTVWANGHESHCSILACHRMVA